MQISSAGASASIHGIQIIKSDAANADLRLAGAKFELYGWDGNQWQKSPKNYVTDKNGSLVITGADILPDRAYKIVEVQAPPGYAISANSTRYFVLLEQPNATVSEPNDGQDPAYKKNVYYFYQSGVFYFSDEKTTGSIVIEKKWLDAQGNAMEPPNLTNPIHCTLFKVFPDGTKYVANGNIELQANPDDPDWNWKYTATQLPVSENGQALSYEVVEDNPASEWEVSYSSQLVSLITPNGYPPVITITNQMKRELTQLPSTGGFPKLFMSGLAVLTAGLWIRSKSEIQKQPTNKSVRKRKK